MIIVINYSSLIGIQDYFIERNKKNVLYIFGEVIGVTHFIYNIYLILFIETYLIYITNIFFRLNYIFSSKQIRLAESLG